MRAICFLPAVLALAPALSWGLDPMTADILTLRLGMRSAEAMAHLAIQGAPVTQGPGAPDGGGSILARTRDGQLRIAFSPAGEAREIVYMFNGRGPNEANLVRDAVIARFGRPLLETPLTWCRAPMPDGVCPSGQPRLSFRPDGGPAGVLTLTAEAAP